MKKSTILLFLAMVYHAAFSQVPTSPDSLRLNEFLLDFTVPDIPAFKALGTNPSDILRPSDLKKFAIMMDAFNSNNTVSIPKSFALEVAPWKLGSKNVPFYTYRTNAAYHFLYNTSFSLGTLRDSGNVASKLALGAKFKILGKNADFITDSKRIDSAYSILVKIEALRSQMEDDWKKKNNISASQFDSSKQKEFSQYFEDSLKKYKAFGFDLSTDKNYDLQQAISNQIKKFNQDNWNAGRMDAAVAWLGASSDSLVKNLHYKSWQGWVTFATRPSVNNHHTQFLFGLIGSLDKKINDSLRTANWALNFRWYEGTKDLHAYLEFQAKSDSINHNPTNTLINLGAEIRIVQNFWIVFSGGVDHVFNSDFEKRFISSLSLKYAFNKK
jgi:hypothetical protein